MIKRAAIAIALCGLATPALASEWISCASPDGGASFDFLVGTLDVLSVAGMTITAGEQVWATDPAYGPGTPVVVGQAFETADTILIDAMDEAIITRIASLRLFKAVEGDGDPVYAGTLHIPEYGAWAVSCTGP
ncbi:hypothetical protein [Devosia sp.]|uniref:hypothetical protein n=1 Tax=Devosia sp. TaxID=1871048 RepID=UPI003A921D94